MLWFICSGCGQVSSTSEAHYICPNCAGCFHVASREHPSCAAVVNRQLICARCGKLVFYELGEILAAGDALDIADAATADALAEEIGSGEVTFVGFFTDETDEEL